MKDLGADYRDGWSEAPPLADYRNPYRVGWENFLRHVATGAPMPIEFRRRHPRCAVRRSLPPQHGGTELGFVSAPRSAQPRAHHEHTPSRTALVTGASTGLGLATALALGRAGYDLAVTDLDTGWLSRSRIAPI